MTTTSRSSIYRRRAGRAEGSRLDFRRDLHQTRGDAVRGAARRRPVLLFNRFKGDVDLIDAIQATSLSDIIARTTDVNYVYHDAFATPKYFAGSAGNNSLNGSLAADLMVGFDGNDIVVGRSGDDDIHGGEGGTVSTARAGTTSCSAKRAMTVCSAGSAGITSTAARATTG